MIVVLLGAPGSGKGTQGLPLAEKLGLAHVASGDMFREHLGKGTELGVLAKSYMDKGELVPDGVTIRMIEERLARPDAVGGVILDGFPRTLPQAESLEESLAKKHQKVDAAPLVQVSTEELLRRLSGRWICRVCGRSYHVISNPPKHDHVCDVDGGELYQRDDDNIEVARKRLQVYFEQTQPVVDFYRARGVLAQINGEQSIESVCEDLVRAIRRRDPESSAVA